MLTEHEKLKIICDKIGYNIDIYLSCDKLQINPFFSIREIIFTQDFWNLYKKEVFMDSLDAWDLLLSEHLNNPVDYLGKIIGIKY